METPLQSQAPWRAAAKQIVQRCIVIAENRLQLLVVEAEEERARILQALWLALGTAVFGLLAGLVLTGAIVLALWEHSPLLTLLVLTAVYAGAAIVCFWRVERLQRNWHTLPETLDQLRKDGKWLKQNLF